MIMNKNFFTENSPVTDLHSAVEPTRTGWSPTLVRSASSMDTRTNLGGKENKEVSPSDPTTTGWSPFLTRSASTSDARSAKQGKAKDRSSQQPTTGGLSPNLPRSASCLDNRTDQSPRKGWGLFGSKNRLDSNGSGTKHGDTRRENAPAQAEGQGWPIFGSMNNLGNRAEQESVARGAAPASPAAKGRKPNLLDFFNRDRMSGPDRSKGSLRSQSTPQLDLVRPKHGGRAILPGMNEEFPSHPTTSAGPKVNLLGNSNKKCSTNQDSIKKASDPSSSQQLLLDFGQRSQSTPQINLMRPKMRAGRAFHRLSPLSMQPRINEAPPPPQTATSPTTQAPLLKTKIDETIESIILGHVKQQTKTLSAAECEAIHHKIQQDKEKRNGRYAGTERKGMQGFNDPNSLFMRLQKHKQNKEGGQKINCQAAEDKAEEAPIAVPDAMITSPTAVPDAMLSLLNCADEKKIDENYQLIAEELPVEEEGVQEDAPNPTELDKEDYLKNTDVPPVETVIVEKNEGVDDMIQLKLQLANQLALVDSLSSKLQQFEISHNIKQSVDLAKTKRLEAENEALREQLNESRTREIKLKTEMNNQHLDHDRAIGLIDSRNSILERKNFMLERELTILRNSLQSSLRDEKGSFTIKSITTETTMDEGKLTRNNSFSWY
mmetsp:Transcript_35994/g.61402  ORF Transcript_35994/g.61402 Transcript_35994/m.61402 type:complete len:660 (-) Transcript_35994:137-2116(-)